MTSPLESSYIISGGKTGVDRLRVLAKATWPGSHQWLRSQGLGVGVSVLDLGCGGGEITFAIASEVGPQARVVGVDSDPEAIQMAQSDPRTKAYPNLAWVCGDAGSARDLGQFDFVYLRFLLSHLAEPGDLLNQVRRCLKPSGRIVIEDVDFEGHFSFPRSWAFDRYVELYIEAARARGADPCIGPKLAALLQQSGYQKIAVSLSQPVFTVGEGKQMAELTWRAIRPAIMDQGGVPESEAQEIDRELSKITAEPHSMLSLPRIFQVSANPL